MNSNQQQQHPQQINSPEQSSVLSNAQLLSARPMNRRAEDMTYSTPSTTVHPSINTQPIGTGLTSLSGVMSEQPLMRSVYHAEDNDGNGPTQLQRPMGFGDMNFTSSRLYSSQLDFSVPSKANLQPQQQEPAKQVKAFVSLTDEQVEISLSLQSLEPLPTVMENVFAFEMTVSHIPLSNLKLQQYVLQIVCHAFNQLNVTVDMFLVQSKQKLLVAVYSEPKSAVMSIKLYRVEQNPSTVVCEIQRRQGSPIDFFNEVFQRLQDQVSQICNVSSATRSLAAPPTVDRRISFEQHLHAEDEQHWQQFLQHSQAGDCDFNSMKRMVENLFHDASNVNVSVEKRREALQHLCDLLDYRATHAQTYLQLFNADAVMTQQFIDMLTEGLKSRDRNLLTLTALLIQHSTNQANANEIKTKLKHSTLLNSIEQALNCTSHLSSIQALNPSQSTFEQQQEQDFLYKETRRQLQRAKLVIQQLH